MATPKKTGRRRRYSKIEKTEALHVMIEDAKSRPDDIPNYSDVSRATGVSPGSLRTWWSAHKRGRFEAMADRQDAGRPDLVLPSMPAPLREMTQAQYATWRLESLQASQAYASKVGNFTAVATIDRRMSEHQSVVVSEREKARPADSRLERLRERVIAAGLCA